LGKITIRYKAEVIDFLNQLVYDLYKREYFSYLESALNYKNAIINFIRLNIHIAPSKNIPPQLAHLGEKYITFISNKRTAWYIFFIRKENRVLITYILNNHSEEAQWLVK
jgi:hypothetical protein